MKRLADFIKNPGPATDSALPEQAHGWVPGAVIALKEPAPIRVEGQQHPDGLAQRAGKMDNGRVRRHDQIEITHHRRCIRKIGEKWGDVGSFIA